MSVYMPSLALLSGGLATRMYPLTRTIPKSLLEVAGKPFIAHQIELLKRNGIEHIVLCVGHLSEQIMEFVGDGSKFGVKVEYSLDGEKRMGTGGAIKKALPLLGDEFFVMYGDSYLDTDFAPVYQGFTASRKKGLMTVLHNKNQWDKSNVVFKDGVIVKYSKTDNDDMEYIDYGLGLLKKPVFSDYPEDEPIDLARIYSNLVDSKQLAGYMVNNRFYEIGSAEGLSETEEYLLSSPPPLAGEARNSGIFNS